MECSVNGGLFFVILTNKGGSRMRECVFDVLELFLSGVCIQYFVLVVRLLRVAL